MKFISIGRKRKKLNAIGLNAAMQRALSSPVEPLERRLMLSITTTPLAGPYDVAGTQWTYSITSGQGQTQSLVQTALGLQNFQGTDHYAFDQNGVGKNYTGLDSAGDYVMYASVINGKGITQTSVDSPYQISLPATMSQGVDYTSTFNETQTSVSSVTSTTSSTVTSTLRLMSETATPITVPAGGPYAGYTIEETQTIVDHNPDGSDTTTNYVIDSVVVPNIGLVQSNNVTDGSVTTLTKFTQDSQKLVFTSPPSDAEEGKTISPAITVQVQNGSGTPDTSATGTITLKIQGSSSSGVLSGTLIEPLVGGTATFNDLSIDKNGTCTLAASDSATPPVVSAISTQFKVGLGSLNFQPAPVDGTAGVALKSFAVAVQDNHGITATSDNSTVVTLSLVGLYSGNPIQSAPVTVVNGIATFTNVVLPKPGFYQIQASDSAGDTVATSGKFKVSGYKLVFQVSPKKSVDANIPIPIKVLIEDAKNKIVTTATSTVVLQLNTVTGGAGATLAGTTSLAFSGGVAFFSPGPSINKPGTFTITATEEDMSLGTLGPTNTTAPITSTPFSVGGYHLVFVKKPPVVGLGDPILISVDVEDSAHKRDKLLNSGGVHFDLTLISGNANAKLGIVQPDSGFASGLDTFTTANSLYVGGGFEGGTYLLTAHATDSTGAIDPSIVSATFQPLTVKGDKLVFTAQPPPIINVAENIPCAIQLQNYKGKLIPYDSVPITLAGPPEAVGNGSPFYLAQGAVNLIGGNATASQNAVAISKAGKYTLTFEIAPNVDAVSKPFKVNGYHLEFIANPTTINYNQKETFTVAIKDSRGNINTADNTTQITVSNMPNAAQVTLSSGTYAFNDYLTDQLHTHFTPGKGYTLSAFADTYPGGLTPVGNGTSKKFDIEGFHLAFAPDPAASTPAGSLVGFVVELLDSKNRVYSDNVDGVQIRLVPAPGSSAAPTLSGPTYNTFINGSSSFGGFTILTPGTYTIVATEVDEVANPVSSLVAGGTDSATSRSFTIT